MFLSRHCHYTSYLTCHIIPHIYAPILLIFNQFLGQNKAALVASKHPKCSGGDTRLFTLSEPNRFTPVRTRSVTSNILAQRGRRNGNATWRRRSCPCEHLHLITREKMLLNGDVARRNGNATYSVNRPFVNSLRFSETLYWICYDLRYCPPCSLVTTRRRKRGLCLQERNEEGTDIPDYWHQSSSLRQQTCHPVNIPHLSIWRYYKPQKRWHLHTRLHGVITQNTV
jgi:hypothetical protein